MPGVQKSFRFPPETLKEIEQISNPGDQFSRIAGLLKKFVSNHPGGLEPFVVELLSKEKRDDEER